jgi:hypothetical protein
LLTNNSEISLNINDNIGDPLAASSPKPPPPPRNKKRFYVQNNLFRVLTVHFRSCKNKVPQIENLLTSSKHDIIIRNEIWLNKNVLSSEVFPSTLFEDVFRNDRDSRECRCVLIAIKKGIICQEVFKSEKVELIDGQINITDTKSLIIVSAYRPPSKTDIDY